MDTTREQSRSARRELARAARAAGQRTARGGSCIAICVPASAGARVLAKLRHDSNPREERQQRASSKMGETAVGAPVAEQPEAVAAARGGFG